MTYSLTDFPLLLVQPPTTAITTAAKEKPLTIAFAVTVTSCESGSLADAAAVLKHSIHRASVHGRLGGRYNYNCIALYHPQAEECAAPLQDLGWKLVPRHVLVNVSDIRGDFLRKGIQGNGCCGEKELIKLEAYTLTDYPVVVHMDLDTMVLQPMDDLFDIILSPTPIDSERYKTILMQHSNNTIPERVNAIFTYDYNMVSAGVKFRPVQGGLIVLRPDKDVYERFRQIYLEGDFRSGEQEDGSFGWGGQVGPFYGGMTFQGVVPYYYNVLYPGQSLELNRCVYNQMCDNPREPTKENSTEPGLCLTDEDDCEDCRERPMEDIVTAHYTICLKPWWCHAHGDDSIDHRLCRSLTREWFRVRSEMEQLWGRSGNGTGDYETDVFFGYCLGHGQGEYVPIQRPYGRPTIEQQGTDPNR